MRGNQLPNAPTYKWSVGAQYTVDMGGSGWTVVPRADINYTGNAYGTIFNKNPIDRMQVVGRAHNRVDGPVKTTGTAPYAYEHHIDVPNAAYGYLVPAAIAKG